jgi:uncharacterized protein YndB with AHSA1/START domain
VAQPLEASIDIDAAPERVWAIVSDLERMPQWSPQCTRMKVIGRLREGALTLNLNRDGWKRWPTTARVVRVQPNREVAFRVIENRAIWSFQIEPTATGSTLIQRRDVPNGTSWISRTLIDLVLGGGAEFDVRVEDGMHQSLAKIKAAAERP